MDRRAADLLPPSTAKSLIQQLFEVDISADIGSGLPASDLSARYEHTNNMRKPVCLMAMPLVGPVQLEPALHSSQHAGLSLPIKVLAVDFRDLCLGRYKRTAMYFSPVQSGIEIDISHMLSRLPSRTGM